jgi:hypothetical protein
LCLIVCGRIASHSQFLVDGLNLVEQQVWRLFTEGLLDVYFCDARICEIIEALPCVEVLALIGMRCHGALMSCGANESYVVPRVKRYSAMADNRLQHQLEVAEQRAFLLHAVVGDEVR